VTAAAFAAQLKNAFPNDLAAAQRVFPSGSDTEAWLSAVALASDNFIGYNTWKWLEVHASTGQAPVYRYLFDQIIPTATGDPAPNDPGAAHATDIEFVFNTLDSKKLAWRPADRKVADMLGLYWTNFARSGDPNGTGLPTWPAMGPAAGRQVMRLNATAKAETETHRARYEFLDAIERRKRGVK
jgi:para-nitrobenzyl esterase